MGVELQARGGFAEAMHSPDILLAYVARVYDMEQHALTEDALWQSLGRFFTPEHIEQQFFAGAYRTASLFPTGAARMVHEALGGFEATKIPPWLVEARRLVEGLLCRQRLAFWHWDLIVDDVTHAGDFTTMMNEAGKVPSYQEWFSLLHPEDRPRVMEIMAQRFQGLHNAARFSFRLWKPWGEWRRYEMVAIVSRWRSDGIAAEICGMVRDVTGMALVSGSGAKRQQAYLAFLDSIQDPAIRTDTNYQYTYVNRAWCDATGLEPEEVIGRGVEVVAHLFHPDDMASAQADLEGVLSNQTRRSSIVRYKGRRGEWRWMDHILYPWYKEDGFLGGMEAIGRDVTQVKEAEALAQRRGAILNALARVSQELLKPGRWLDCMCDGLCQLAESLDVDRGYLLSRDLEAGGHTAWTARAVWEAGAKPGGAFKPLQGVRIPPGPPPPWMRSLELGVSLRGPEQELHGWTKDSGSRGHALSSVLVPVFRHGAWYGILGFDARNEVRPWHESEVGALETVARTIGAALDREAAERTMEQQRMQMVSTARLSSLGVLASGIAHEINNPLAVVSLVAEQLANEQETQAQSRGIHASMALRLRRNVHRIERIVRSLRNLAGGDEGEPLARRPIRSILDDLMDLYQARFTTAGIRYEVAIEPGDLEVTCRPMQTERLLASLVSNAFDAVLDANERWIKVDARDAGEGVEIRVRDSGPGIPDAIRERIMEPFFTTKPQGKGMGIGLSTARASLESTGGSLQLDASEGHTCFVVRLPG